MGSLAGRKARREPADEAKPNVCVISDGEAGAYCTVGLVFFKLFKLNLWTVFIRSVSQSRSYWQTFCYIIDNLQFVLEHLCVELEIAQFSF